MQKSRFTEEQIIKVLKEHAAGLSAGEVCREYGISDATFYKWRSRYGGMEVSDARKLKALEDENRPLPMLLLKINCFLSEQYSRGRHPTISQKTRSEPTSSTLLGGTQRCAPQNFFHKATIRWCLKKLKVLPPKFQD